MSASDNESSCPLQPATTATGIRTTAPQVFCVASLATLPSTLFISSPATVSAPSQPPWAPAAINLQALLQPMIAEAVQRAFHDLPSLAAANAPSSSSAAYTQPSCSLPQAPSSLGESLHFPSFVSTMCLATGMLPSPFMSTLASFSANSMLALLPSLLQCRPYHRPCLPQVCPPPLPPSLPPLTPSSRVGCPGFDVGPGCPLIPPKLAEFLPDSSQQRVAPGAPPREPATCDSQTPTLTRSQRHHVVARLLDSISTGILPSRAVELLKYLDLIVRTHSSFPSADVWLW